MASDISTLDIKEIVRLLPHRYPFLLVDRILEGEKGKSMVGLKNVSMNEPFFQGHFPSDPIMPGVLILEGMAQVGGILAFYSLPEMIGEKLIYFAGIDKVRFRSPVVPGDQLIFEMVVIKHKGKIWKMAGTAKVDNKIVAEAEFMAAFV
ncbi:MAG: 3-hydroxyacyl-ACP dehydratase FabZ [Deltaproteobacteria bacterium]|jgi:3-hydroxyacyl-[acyl-carrier-protein] dehydratase|nr:MAG: 3-hydroxyacyl-ACP dehydratase FabZ [Deltaproteobacteria bacterium]